MPHPGDMDQETAGIRKRSPCPTFPPVRQQAGRRHALSGELLQELPGGLRFVDSGRTDFQEENLRPSFPEPAPSAWLVQIPLKSPWRTVSFSGRVQPFRRRPGGLPLFEDHRLPGRAYGGQSATERGGSFTAVRASRSARMWAGVVPQQPPMSSLRRGKRSPEAGKTAASRSKTVASPTSFGSPAFGLQRGERWRKIHGGDQPEHPLRSG